MFSSINRIGIFTFGYLIPVYSTRGAAFTHCLHTFLFWFTYVCLFCNYGRITIILMPELFIFNVMRHTNLESTSLGHIIKIHSSA